MSVETDADGATEGATVQESQDTMRQQCKMHRVVAAVQRSKKEHLLVIEGASALGVFLA